MNIASTTHSIHNRRIPNKAIVEMMKEMTPSPILDVLKCLVSRNMASEEVSFTLTLHVLYKPRTAGKVVVRQILDSIT